MINKREFNQTLKLLILVFILFNIILTIFCSTNLQFNNKSFSSLRLLQGNSDNSPLVCEWYNIWGTENAARGDAIQVDALNNTYIVGGNGLSDSDVVLIKYDHFGNLFYNNTLWPFNEEFYYTVSFSIDSQNNLIIVKKNHVLKTNNTGSIIYWQMYLDKFYYINGIILDNKDCIYLTGEVNSSLFLTKLNSSGEQLWSRSWTGLNGNSGYDLALDKSNNIYVTGKTNSFYNWDDMKHNADIPILKYNSSGHLLWNITWRSPYYTINYYNQPFFHYHFANGNAIILDSNDIIYITGVSHYWSLLLRYNQSDGEFWYDHIQTEHGEGVDLEVDYDDNIYVCSLYDDGSDCNFLLTKYDSTGQRLWNSTWGGNDDDYPAKMALISPKDLVVVGSTWSFSTSYRDIVLVKFGVEVDTEEIHYSSEDPLIFTIFVLGISLLTVITVSLTFYILRKKKLNSRFM